MRTLKRQAITELDSSLAHALEKRRVSFLYFVADQASVGLVVGATSMFWILRYWVPVWRLYLLLGGMQIL